MKTKTEKFTFEEDIYYYVLQSNNEAYIVDENFIRLPENLSERVSLYYFKQKDYLSLNKEELFDLIKQTKLNKCYEYSKKLCIFALEKFKDYNYRKLILPILTSCCRNTNDSKLAIEYFEKYSSYTHSKALYTSIAAAYCDVGDLKKAIYYANKATQMGQEGFDELSLVWKRISKLKQSE